jgi:hypothetical protein
MQYEETKIQNKVSPKVSSKLLIKAAERLSTLQLIWLLVKRHKVALLATANIMFVINWALPEWPQMIVSLFV